MTNWINELSELIKPVLLKQDVSLANLTTIKIGGSAKVFVQTEDPRVIQEIRFFCSQNKLPFIVLGGGSNMLFRDEEFPGVILKLPLKPFSIEEKGESIEVTFPAGYSSNLAAQKMQEQGFSGFEAMAGLPGTLGGAIYMNSKWPKSKYQTCDNLLMVTYLNEKGEVVTRPKNVFVFSYGHSSFQTQPWIILSAVFSFTKAKPEKILEEMHSVLRYREESQPTGVFTAGCVFKNLSNLSAGYLIDQCGLKGHQIGGIQVSTKHANFFINTGSATNKDYQQMVDLVKEKVRSKFKVELVEEVYNVHYGIHH